MLIGYNALNYRFRQSGIEAAHQNGMGVVVMNPLGGGMIPSNPESFAYLVEGTDLTVPQAALRFVASHKEITITEERPAKEIEIPKFMDSYNQMILTGESKQILDRLNGHWSIKKEKAEECIACGKCEGQCTQHLPISERMKEIAAM